MGDWTRPPLSHLTSNGGKYQWDAKLACYKPGEPKKTERITVFADDRSEANRAAVDFAKQLGYWHATVDHTTKIGNRQ